MSIHNYFPELNLLVRAQPQNRLDFFIQERDDKARPRAPRRRRGGGFWLHFKVTAMPARNPNNMSKTIPIIALKRSKIITSLNIRKRELQETAPG